MDIQQIRAIRDLNARLPTIDCQRRCTHSCRTRIDMSRIERDRIEAFLGEPLPQWMHELPGQPCPLLTADGACSVHRLRPLICRLWGIVDTPGMSCPHGCTVRGDKITMAEANRLIIESFQAGGHDREDDFDYDRMGALVDVPDLVPLVERYVRGDHAVLGDILDRIDQWERDQR